MELVYRLSYFSAWMDMTPCEGVSSGLVRSFTYLTFSSSAGFSSVWPGKGPEEAKNQKTDSKLITQNTEMKNLSV